MSLWDIKFMPDNKFATLLVSLSGDTVRLSKYQSPPQFFHSVDIEAFALRSETLHNSR